MNEYTAVIIIHTSLQYECQQSRLRADASTLPIDLLNFGSCGYFFPKIINNNNDNNNSNL